MTRLGRLALFAALPTLGLLELGLWALTRRVAPRFDAYESLGEPVRSLRREGDVVVVSPRWAEPAARRALGDDLFPIAELGRSDLERFEGAVEISLLGEVTSALSGWPITSEQTVGAFSVRHRDNPTPRPVLFDFVDHVAPPELAVTFGSPAAPCRFNPRARVMAGGLGGHPTFPPARFECPGSVFFNASVTVIADEQFLPRRCIWAHPPAIGDLVLAWDRVPLGRTLEGHSGMYWIIERTRRGAPVTLEASVDGEIVGASVHADGEGWRPFSFDLGGRAGTSGSVTFRVRSDDHRNRHFCFEATSR